MFDLQPPRHISTLPLVTPARVRVLAAGSFIRAGGQGKDEAIKSSDGARRGNRWPCGADLNDGLAAGRIRKQRDACGCGGRLFRRCGRGRVGRRGFGRRLRWRARVFVAVPRRRLATWRSLARAFVTLPWIATALRASR